MKNILRTIILFWGFLLNRNRDSKIIYYHDIGTQFTDMGTDWSLFKRHIQIIKKLGYIIVDNAISKENEIQICFDDGWKGIYEVKDKIISMGIKPTVFIAVDLIGSEGHLTLDQILEMQELGYLFQGHTWTHRDLTLVAEDELEREIVASKEKLSQMLGRSVTSICFPCGRFSDKIVKISKETGYEKIYSSINGSCFTFLSEGLLCRILCQSLNPLQFRFAICGFSKFLMNRTLKMHKA